MKGKGSMFEHNSLNMRLNLATGLYVPTLSAAPSFSPRSLALAAYRLCGDFFVVAGLLSFLTKVFTKDTSLSERCVVISIVFSAVQVTLKMTYMAWHRQSFLDYFNLWDESFQRLDPSHELRSHRQSEMRRVKILTGVFLALALPALPMNLMPLLPASQRANGGRYLAIPAWYPFDALASPAFELTVAFQTLTGCVAITRLVAFDAFFFSLAAMQVGQTKHLDQCLGRVFWPQDEGGVLAATTCTQVCSDVELLRIGQRKRKADRQVFDKRLKKWIRYHQDVMRMGEKLQELYSPILLVEFVTMTLVLCFSAFVFVAVPLDAARRQMFVMYALSHISQLYAFCHFGDRLEASSCALRESAFDCGWHEKAVLPETSSCLRMLFQRVQKPLRLSAYGVVALNSETFLSIVRTAISYLMVLIEVLS